MLFRLSPLLLLFFYSCTISSPGIFSKTSLHEQYGKKITDAGLKETALGRQWFAAADKALSNPVLIKLPYKEVGYFPADKPRAVGLQFSAKRGEKLLIQLDKKPEIAFALYADLWKINESGRRSSITFFDTSKSSFSYEIEETGNYLFRLQPELLRSGEYTLSLTTGASLGFPVAGKNARIGGVWGDARDGGVRKHEGIDIFAPLRTPVIAAEDGFISAVNENNLGGKVVWMRAKDRNYTLYYAHLDEQLVSSGQRVKKGDTLGLMGTTGNARGSSPHLHFGIYAVGGAVDPLPFVNTAIKKPAEVDVNPDKLNNYLRATKSIKTNGKTYNSNIIIIPVAATAKLFRVELPDGSIAEIPTSETISAVNALRTSKTKTDSYLYELPDNAAPRKTGVKASATVKVKGYFNEYTFIQTEEGKEGWIPSTNL